jgi:capsular polysaccharide export protein
MSGAAPQDNKAAGMQEASQRLFVYNGGFLTQKRVRRVLELSGWQVRLGAPSEGDWVGVWGNSPTAHRGEAVAARRAAPVLRVEDAFLRSVLPGRAGGGPGLGLLLDRRGVHFDSAQPSDLEQLLATHPLDDAALLNRARAAISWMARAHLSKYNAFDPATALPPEIAGAPYVLVIDQTRGDASVAGAGADASRFAEMLYYARAENPGARIVIKTHPETAMGQRAGHFSAADTEGAPVTLLSAPISPWVLLESASAVYTVSSGMGFEAILAGHKPRLFGQPFYAGWGLSDDRFPLDRRQRKLTRAQLFAGAMMLYPKWYDPYRDRLCEIETVLGTLEAESRAWREDRRGYVATGMRLWKRMPLQQVFGRETRLVFEDQALRAMARAQRETKPLLCWAGKVTPELDAAGVHRVEDGFLRSRGLGADLIPPLSLVVDQRGIYYDPSRESDLEQHVTAAAALPEAALERAARLITRLRRAKLSKYNLDRPAPLDLPEGRRILVPGQVEDDASIRLGAGEVRSNRALIEAARAAHPDAVILYKPHPDVEAGLRDGALGPQDTAAADLVLHEANPIALIEACDEVWTMTSLLGFEALLRDTPVTCLGAPFYAGWGLTRDLGPVPARRRARPTLEALVHATLIAYPRYFDPVTRRPCPVEIVVDRLEHGPLPRPGPFNRSVAKLQGWFASYAWMWR